MTSVRGKRGRVVHAWDPGGTRRDLAPEEIPNLRCSARISGPIVVDEPVTCPRCLKTM